MWPNKLLAVPGWASFIRDKVSSPLPPLCLGTEGREVGCGTSSGSDSSLCSTAPAGMWRNQHRQELVDWFLASNTANN